MPTRVSPPSLRVLQVLPELNDGGVEQSACEMAGFLSARRIFNAVASAGGRKEAVLATLGVPHFKLPLARKNPLAVFYNAWKLRRLIKEHGITVVHARSRAPAWAAWLATRGLKGCRYLTTFHGTYGARGFLKRRYNRVMLQGPVVVANSRFIRQHIVETYGYPAKNIVVAARGVDPAVFDPAHFTKDAIKAVRASLGVKGKTPMLIVVGRLTRWKGQHVLLEALASLKHLDWHCVLAGGPDKRGDYAHELAALITRRGLEGRVTMAGSRGDVPLLLAASQLAFSTSTEPEAFGRAAIEAQAMGVPVIATALGGSLETVKDGKTGRLIAPNVPQVLAERIAELLTNPADMRRLGAQARPWVLEHFTVETCCLQEMSAYRRLLDEM